MAEKISRIYSNFRGVDFRGEEINLTRSPDSVNMWKDYRETESIRTRPDIERVRAFADTVYGIFFYSAGGVDIIIVHSGDKLYRLVGAECTEIYSGVAKARSESFVYSGVWYFKDGTNYLQYNGEVVAEVEGYVPTTSISRNPLGGGTVYQDVNLLTGKRINTFVADGESKEYHLDSTDIDSGFTPEVTIDGISTTDFTTDFEKGVIKFTKAPSKPLTDGQDNVSITFCKTIDGYADRIKKCTLLTMFDNRVFFSGNPDFPNVLYHCSLNDPTYCSDLDYYNEGLDESAIRGMVASNNGLWVFREPSDANTTVFYHVPTQDADYGKIYPNTHSSIATGCIGRAINFNDDTVFFSDRGMEGISGDITTEQVISHRSTMVDRKLTAEANYKNMLLEEWDGYLLVFIDDRVYLADSRGIFTNENHTEYEWFYWNMKEKVTSVKVNDGILYIGTANGLYTLTKQGNVDSHWVTPKDKFGYPSRLKTTNKRGCVVEALGDVSVFAKIEDTSFELIGTYKNVSDYFVSRIKRKKFKDIQLKFHSNTRFSLETATLEAYIGGYIKR